MLQGSKAEYEVAVFQFACSLILAMEEAIRKTCKCGITKGLRNYSSIAPFQSTDMDDYTQVQLLKLVFVYHLNDFNSV